MKYFVLEIVTANGATAKQVTEKDSLEHAKMLFHQIMASALANDAVTYALCMVIDERGYCRITETKPADLDIEE